MQTPPDRLPDDVLAPALSRVWGVRAERVDYRPTGFGSHHWEVTDTTGGRWFVTADDVTDRRRSRHEPAAAAADRLRASLATAQALYEHGRRFVVAPVPTRDGEPLTMLADSFATALYPFVDGHGFEWGDFITAEHRAATLDLIVAVHTAPADVVRHAVADDFTIDHREDLMAALDDAGAPPEHGPFGRPAADLLAGTAAPLRRLLARYDRLAADARARRRPTVLTHGEPHAGNTMLTADGWVLVDWDTALVAPPERDLWLLDPGDGSLLGAYTDATGLPPLPALLELYRVRWDLADLAVLARRFRGHHSGTDDDEECWRALCRLVEHVAAGTGGPFV